MILDPLSVGLSLGEMGYNIYGAIKASQKIKEVNQTREAKFMDAADPLLQSRRLYEKQYRTGMGIDSRNLAEQNFASSQLSNQRAITDMSGGQMSSALSRMASVNNANFALGLAGQNDAIRRQGLAGMASENRAISSLQQSQVQRDIGKRDTLLREYGQAKQDRIGSVFSGALGIAEQGMAMDSAEADRQMYRDIYGMGGNDNQGEPQVPSMGSMTMKPSLPYSMGGLSGLRRFQTPKSYIRK